MNPSICGDTLFYLDDQSDVLEGVGQSEECKLNLKELETFVKLKTGDLLIDIPRFFLDKEYQKQAIPPGEYPLGFFDNFNDIKMTTHR